MQIIDIPITDIKPYPNNPRINDEAVATLTGLIKEFGFRNPILLNGDHVIIESAKAKGLWTPGEGKTPEQTLYSAIVREIKVKAAAARFTAVGKGLFKLNAPQG